MHHTFKKYHDLPAAIAIGLYLLGAHFYIVQTIFMTDAWLAAREIGIEAAPIVRIMGATYLGFAVGLILTFVNGPDGQRTFFNALLVAQVLTLVILRSSSCGRPTSWGAFPSARPPLTPCSKMPLPSLC